jgi:hypothetical protein
LKLPLLAADKALKIDGLIKEDFPLFFFFFSAVLFKAFSLALIPFAE